MEDGAPEEPFRILFDTVVLLYPRSVGAFNPLTAEWIMILNARWPG